MGAIIKHCEVISRTSFMLWSWVGSDSFSLASSSSFSRLYSASSRLCWGFKTRKRGQECLHIALSSVPQLRHCFVRQTWPWSSRYQIEFISCTDPVSTRLGDWIWAHSWIWYFWWAWLRSIPSIKVFTLRGVLSLLTEPSTLGFSQRKYSDCSEYTPFHLWLQSKRDLWGHALWAQTMESQKD